jgi:DNA-binding PadR family transcriptional regulator
VANPVDSTRDLYVLGTLSRGKTHGHDLMRTIRISRADRWVSLSEKHVYYVLAKLARRGLVTETTEPGPVARKVYGITTAGRIALADLLRSSALRETFATHPFDAVFGMLAFTDVLGQAEVVSILRARRDAIAARIQADAIPPAGRAAMEKAFGYLALALYEKSQALLAAELAWLESVVRKVERGDLKSLRVPATYLDAKPRSRKGSTRA